MMEQPKLGPVRSRITVVEYLGDIDPANPPAGATVHDVVIWTEDGAPVDDPARRDALEAAWLAGQEE
jgi:hypothetical protein